MHIFLFKTKSHGNEHCFLVFESPNLLGGLKVDDSSKLFSIQRSSSNKTPINVWLCHELVHTIRCNRSSVLNSCRLSSLLVIEVRQNTTEKDMNIVYNNARKIGLVTSWGNYDLLKHFTERLSWSDDPIKRTGVWSATSSTHMAHVTHDYLLASLAPQTRPVPIAHTGSLQK